MLVEQMHKYLRIKFQDHWYPERPTQGSAYRSIRISKEKIDKVLINATNDISLDLKEILESLPTDLTIWIDPGEVSYRVGEKGPSKCFVRLFFSLFNQLNQIFMYTISVQILYRNQRHLIRCSERLSDTDKVLNQGNISHHFCIANKTGFFSIETTIIPVQSMTEDLKSYESNDMIFDLSSINLSEFPPCPNRTSTPVLSIHKFAQTRFGSLKNKHTGSRRSIR